MPDRFQFIAARITVLACRALRSWRFPTIVLASRLQHKFRRACIRLVLLSIATMITAAPGVAAQTAGTAALTGMVYDSTEAVIPDAKIELTNESTRETRHAAVGSDGHYAIPLLPPGRYTLRAVSKGFKTAVYREIQVGVTETVQLDIHLTVGQMIDQIVVVSETTDVQTESATLGHVTGEKSVTT